MRHLIIHFTPGSRKPDWERITDCHDYRTVDGWLIVRQGSPYNLTVRRFPSHTIQEVKEE